MTTTVQVTHCASGTALCQHQTLHPGSSLQSAVMTALPFPRPSWCCPHGPLHPRGTRMGPKTCQLDMQHNFPPSSLQEQLSLILVSSARGWCQKLVLRQICGSPERLGLTIATTATAGKKYCKLNSSRLGQHATRLPPEPTPTTLMAARRHSLGLLTAAGC